MKDRIGKPRRPFKSTPRYDPTKHVTKKCIVCGEEFTSYLKQNRKCCSTKCSGVFRGGRDESKFILKKCSHCGKQFEAYRHVTRKCCSKTCAAKNRKGNNAARWQGGIKIDEKGYVLVYAPDHPFATKSGLTTKYIRKHRLVMEKHLGRYLTAEEVIHHVNGNKQDNHIENLQLFSNHSEHMRFCRNHKRRSAS